MVLNLNVDCCFVANDVVLIFVVPAVDCFVANDVVLIFVVTAVDCFVANDVVLIFVFTAVDCFVANDVVLIFVVTVDGWSLTVSFGFPYKKIYNIDFFRAFYYTLTIKILNS